MSKLERNYFQRILFICIHISIIASYIDTTEKKMPPVFPRALEPYDIRPVANELGLTSTERKSLQNGWTIIKQKQRRAALNIYVK